jgi:anti-sigma regulatory factor (Ser/Thr protein kinase)
MARTAVELTVLGTLTLPGRERSVAHARRFVRDMLGNAHPALHDAELCTSELVTNSVTHSASQNGGRVTVTVAVGARLVQVSVADDGAEDPGPHVRDEPYAEDGRGLHIVAAVADEWGMETEDGGTTTWFRLLF